MVELLGHLLTRGEPLLTHNYVIVEAVALIDRRLGLPTAKRALQDMQRFEIQWIDQTLHDEAVRRFTESTQRISLVDQLSFLVMRRRGITTALAFDAHFEAEGFRLYQPPPTASA